MDDKSQITKSKFPPVVSVLGHVDHGKTTLLDAIRKSNIATREAGGITQAIGASKIEIEVDGKKRFITFIDTPGHEAFSNMRSHGVSASDIVLLIVAADDGVKPQTIESIEKIKTSTLPYIVVITKADAPGANIEKVKSQLLKEGVMLEGLGGNVPYIGVSAKTGEKIKDLLDLITIVYDLEDSQASLNGEFLGVVIEAKLDKRRGVLGSLIVKKGVIEVGDKIFVKSKEVGKVRALVDTFGKNVKEAVIGDAVEVLGFSKVLPAGSVILKKPEEFEKKEVEVAKPVPVDILKILNDKKVDKVNVIIKTQTSGEFEAIESHLPTDVEVIFEGRGEISASDILMARDFSAIVVGFNVSIDKQAKNLADVNKTFYRTYDIIYNLLDELNDAVELLKERSQRKISGKAQILATFEGNEGVILGVRVIEGRFLVGDTIVVTRGEEETEPSKITSIKQGKKDVKEMGKGNECGIMLEKPVDFTIGDMVLSLA